MPFMLKALVCVTHLTFALVAPDEPQTVAERSGFQATARYDEVMAFIDKLKPLAPQLRLGELGRSSEGRSIPLLILADPPIATAEEAMDSGKLIAFAFGNIHAGEVCGKEALLMLAREIGTTPDHPLLKDLIIVFAPIYNTDGNERMSKTSRPGQLGPAQGQGQRANAQGLDLNRDYVKLESPEARALVRFMNHWNPAIIIDTHTTNGSHHQYTITYAAPRHPAGDREVIEYVRDTMLPAVTSSLFKETGYKSFFYGNFNKEHTRWSTYPAMPRYGTPYRGLRNRIAILSEAYSYAPYRDRVLATRDFVRHCFQYAAAHNNEIAALLEAARQRTIDAGNTPRADDMVPIRTTLAAFDQPVAVEGFVEETEDGRTVATDQARSYEVRHFGRFESALSVRRPFAYLFPAALTGIAAGIVEKLQQHGIEVEELREDIELDLQVYDVQKVTHAERSFQKHNLVTLEVESRTETRRVQAGAILVRTAQELGTLAVQLLEPQSEDGLTTWNFFDDALHEGQAFPVVRLLEPVSLTRCAVRPLELDREQNKRLTFEAVYESDPRPNLGGSSLGRIRWLPDGEHFLQRKDGQLLKVHAATGRCAPHDNADGNANGNANGQSEHPGARRGCNKDNRVTSPDGSHDAFVRDGNLYVLDTDTQEERALTTDGDGTIRNGRHDWVYFEELYSRNWQAFWWSPDSKHLAFLRSDSSALKTFAVINEIPLHQEVEHNRYPKAGDPNPIVKIGIVSMEGGPPSWVDLSEYGNEEFLISRVGWLPDSKSIYFYTQDRIQTWLDVNVAPPAGEPVTRLFRETSEAWARNPGAPHFLKDGSFILPSERTGWRHLYHFADDGKLIRPITSGQWEARQLHYVDEAGGWVYFSGTRDSHVASNVYRARIDGSAMERLTTAPGGHRASFSPTGSYFIDSHSSHRTPTQVHLYQADGTLVRTLDSNPVHALDEYRLGEYDFFQIEMADGFKLEASLLKPPDFNPDHKYPVWFMTYAGPHAPTVRDSWSGGRLRDRAIAEMGFVVFRCDPRSASGKGIASTWTAYRQLGVGELADITEAINWLKQLPFIDGERIGISGHSYGGFMTVYAMTHSELFAAGIAGAPVTDWRNYDTIYTERYMSTPQDNPDGYDASSAVKAAANLHGRLLLLHGVMDDNVHMQNTLQFAHELQKAGKQFEMMLYPRSRHGLRGQHYNRLFFDFIQRTLGSDTLAAPPDTTDLLGTH
ncbi:MAG: DPP IV N-terminal domain-containing protein [Planctomycetota bacterium]|nr:DPP IV N-terminal domain-containing protein [Planctomycetota bacterium]